MNKKIENRVFYPRDLAKDYLEGKLTKNQFDVLSWIWINADPKNGAYYTGYHTLVEIFREEIGYQAMRKILSVLRREQYVYFNDHRGRKGPFAIYPVNYYAIGQHLLTWEDLKSNTKKRDLEQSQTNPGHNLDDKHSDARHNFNEARNSLINGFSMNRNSDAVTTLDDDDNDIEHRYRSPSKKVDPRLFHPQSREEELCREIAVTLNEPDMRCTLSYLKKYGAGIIERRWAEFKEIKNTRSDIKNPAAYFNKMLRQGIG